MLATDRRSAMSPRRRRRRSRALVLAWTLPLFLLGPVLNGRTFLWHAHDDAGAHLHVLAEHAHDHGGGHATHGTPAHEPWLADEHWEHAHELHDGHPPAPEEHHESDCFLVCFSGPFQVPARSAPAMHVLRAALAPTAPAPRIEAALLPPAAEPRQARVKLRSGTALLVATGRALRI